MIDELQSSWSVGLPNLQNILRTELTTIHHTLQLVNSQFPNEHAYIFTDSLNSLYLLNTQITHPTHHHNHPDIIIFISMVQILQTHIHPLSLYKVRAHIKIPGNE